MGSAATSSSHRTQATEYTKDEAGFHWESIIHADKKPRDFVTDPATGLRPGETTKPLGYAQINMKVGDLKHKVIPSISDWNKGNWWDKQNQETQKELASVPKGERWECWVISGERTPGNYKYRCYFLPKEIAAENRPKHPSMWPKKKEETTYKAGEWEKKPESKLPFGTRIRCVGCGHWFKLDDLGGHVQNTCPAVHGDNCDWAIMCECGGTCNSLDDVVRIKTGFPRPKKKVEEEAKPELLNDLETTPATQEVPAS